MSNPYKTPDDSAELPANSRASRALVVGLMTWGVLIVVASLLGAILSLYTGRASELPTWNGWSYLLFSAKEFALFAVVLTWPVALTAFAVSYFGTHSAKH